MYIFSFLLGSFFSAFKKRKPEAVEMITMRLEIETTRVDWNCRDFARELNVGARVIESLRCYGTFSPNTNVFDYLQSTKTDLTIGTLKRVFTDIGRNNLKELLNEGIVSRLCFFFYPQHSNTLNSTHFSRDFRHWLFLRWIYMILINTFLKRFIWK